MRATAGIVTAAVFFIAAPAAAQQAASLDEVNYSKLIDKPVRITDTRGIERFGKLSGVEDGALRLRVDAVEVTLPFAEIRRLDRRDSVLNGFVLGMLWPPISIPLGAGQGFDNSKQMWRALPGGMLLCGGIGAWLDSLHKGWASVYRADRKPGRSAFGVAPVRRGVRVAFVKRF